MWECGVVEYNCSNEAIGSWSRYMVMLSCPARTSADIWMMARMEQDCRCGREDSLCWFCRSLPTSLTWPAESPVCRFRSRNNRPVSSLKEPPAHAASGRYPHAAHKVLINAINHPLVGIVYYKSFCYNHYENVLFYKEFAKMSIK